jgi:hypothetical protein
MHEQQFNHPPLLVLNSFGPQGMHIKLMATMFQNLFPSINVHTVGQICDSCRGQGWTVGGGADHMLRLH